MSGGAAAMDQPERFAFSPEGRARADAIVARYPPGRQASAVLALLDLAQRQSGGWLPRAAMEHVAGMLDLAPIRVYEVATFYSMFNLRPVGRFHVQVCRTTPCWLAGSDSLTEACRKRLGIGLKERTADGRFSLVEVECLGACVNAPVVQVNDDFYEDLDPVGLVRVLDRLAAGERPAIGSQSGRQGSAPASGPPTLGPAKRP